MTVASGQLALGRFRVGTPIESTVRPGSGSTGEARLAETQTFSVQVWMAQDGPRDCVLVTVATAAPMVAEGTAAFDGQRLREVVTAAERHAIGARTLVRPLAVGLEGNTIVMVYPLAPTAVLANRLGRALADPRAPPTGAVVARPFEPEQVAQILTGIVEPLSVLHGQGIAHGQLQPALITYDSVKVEVGGLGLDAALWTMGGAVACRDGLPARYRSPERCAASPVPSTPAADVYALAVLATELLIGEPHVGASSPLRERGVPVSATADGLLQRALDVDPVHRPADAIAWARGLAVALVTPESKAQSLPPSMSEPSAEPADAPSTAPRNPELPDVMRPDVAPPSRGAPGPIFESPSGEIHESDRSPAERKAPVRAWFGVVVTLLGGLLMFGAVLAAFAYARLQSASSSSNAHAGSTSGSASVNAPGPAPLTAPRAFAKDAGAANDAGAADGAPADGSQDTDDAVTSSAAMVDAEFPAKPYTADDARAALPIGPGTPAWGGANALVTVLIFGDLDCPYTRRTVRHLVRIKGHLGKQLRLVWRHRAQPEHAHAVNAARVAAGVFDTRGPQAFWQFVVATSRDTEMSTKPRLRERVGELGWESASIDAWVDGADMSRAAHADDSIAVQLNVRSTPTLFINGERFDGGPPLHELAARIEIERVQALSALMSGLEHSALYGTRVDWNLLERGAEPPKRSCIPTDGAPARGASEPLVTLAEFSDFECGYCRMLDPMLQDLVRRYPREVRHAWRSFPLGNHPEARPAANLAYHALKHSGLEGFWKAHDLLFAEEPLSDARYEAVAKQLGLVGAHALRVARSGVYDARIDYDIKIGEALGVSGVPTLFVNGRRIEGAKPKPELERLVKREIDGARRLLAAGYERGELDGLLCSQFGSRP